MNFKHQKMIAMLILVSIFSPAVTYAQFSSDLPAQAQRILNIIKDYGLDTLAGVLAELAGAKISNKVLNKATGGASGDSSQNSFITSFTDYFADFERSKVDKFVTDLGISNNPYAQILSKSMIQDAAHAASGQGLGGYTLEQVVGPNWKEFPTNVSKGGIDGLLALSEPINTNIGSGLIAQTELQTNIAKAKELELLKLTVPGTKPQGKCNKKFSDYKSDISKTKAKVDQIKKNKETIKSLNAAQAAGVSVPTPKELAAQESSGEEDPDPNQVKKDLKNENVAAGGEIVKGLIDDYGGCLQDFIQNPIGTTTSMITGALDAGAKKLQAADELGEVIGGMVLSLVNSFIKGGLTALNAEFSPSGNSVGGPEQLVGKNGQSIPWTQVTSTIIDMSTEFPSALNSTRRELDLLRQYSNSVTKDNAATGKDFSDRYLELDQCLPGPDFRFEKRLATYKKAQVSKLERLKEKGKEDNKKWREAVYQDINASVDYAIAEMQQSIQRPEFNLPGANMIQSELLVLETVRNTYQDEQREIRKKQSTLNILNQIESQLKSNVKELNFIDTELNIPDYITFTDSGWERLAAADKTAFVTWAKKLRQLPTKAPLVESEWNALSTVDKKAMVDWAKDITAGSEQSAYDPNIPDKDFVLATVWLLSGVQSRDFVVEPGSTCNLDCVAKKTFSLDALWSIWIYPENYIKDWDPESDKAKEYQKKKNAARTLYNSVLNEISIPYTINQAELALKKIDATNLRMESLYYDCEKIKSIIRENDSLRTDPDGHKKMLTILKARKGELKTPEIRDSITNGASILSDPIGYYQSQPENNCGTNGQCKQDIGIVGDTNDDDDPTDPGLAGIAEFYQVQIPKNVWELVEQGPVAMCRLNRFVKEYTNRQYANVTKTYKPVECDASSNGWMTMTKKSLTSYLFTDGL